MGKPGGGQGEPDREREREVGRDRERERDEKGVGGRKIVCKRIKKTIQKDNTKRRFFFRNRFFVLFF